MDLSKYNYITLEMAEEEKEQRRIAMEKRKEEEEKTTFFALIIALMIMGPIWLYAMYEIFKGTSAVEYAEMIPAAIILIPVLFILGSVANSSFDTKGFITRKKK
jgi:cation transport ATPase